MAFIHKNCCSYLPYLRILHFPLLQAFFGNLLMEIRVAKANPKTRVNLSWLYLPVVYLHFIWRIFWLSKTLSVEREKGTIKIAFWKSLWSKLCWKAEWRIPEVLENYYHYYKPRKSKLMKITASNFIASLLVITLLSFRSSANSEQRNVFTFTM